MQAPVKAQAAAEQEYRYKQIAQVDKEIQSMDQGNGKPGRAGFLPQMVKRNPQRHDPEQNLCLLPGRIFLIPFSAGAQLRSEAKQRTQILLSQDQIRTLVTISEKRLPYSVTFKKIALSQIQQFQIYMKLHLCYMRTA